MRTKKKQKKKNKKIEKREDMEPEEKEYCKRGMRTKGGTKAKNIAKDWKGRLEKGPVETGQEGN